MTDKRPMAAVKALIENEEDEILCLRTEAENSVYWVLPGGRVEYGEEPLEALEREIEEELSCEPEIKDPVGMYYFFIGEDKSGDQVVLTVYEADIDEQEVDISNNPADENITEYRWLKPEELMEKTNNDSLKQLIEEYNQK